jgi:hypothetical protein
VGTMADVVSHKTSWATNMTIVSICKYRMGNNGSGTTAAAAAPPPPADGDDDDADDGVRAGLLKEPIRAIILGGLEVGHYIDRCCPLKCERGCCRRVLRRYYKSKRSARWTTNFWAGGNHHDGLRG